MLFEAFLFYSSPEKTLSIPPTFTSELFSVIENLTQVFTLVGQPVKVYLAKAIISMKVFDMYRLKVFEPIFTRTIFRTINVTNGPTIWRFFVFIGRP